MNNPPQISEAARKAAEACAKSCPQLDHMPLMFPVFIQTAIDEATNDLALKAADRNEWQEVAMKNLSKLERWKECAEKLGECDLIVGFDQEDRDWFVQSNRAAIIDIRWAPTLELAIAKFAMELFGK